MQYVQRFLAVALGIIMMLTPLSTSVASVTDTVQRGVTIARDPQTGAAVSITSTDRQAPLVPSLDGSLEDRAVAALEEYADIFGIQDADQEFNAYTVVESRDDTGSRHVKLSQVFDGRDVLGAEMIVHFDKDDAVYAINGTYLQVEREEAIVGRERAVEVAKETLAEVRGAVDEELVYVNYGSLRGAKSKTELAWRVTLPDDVVFIDAQTSEMLLIQPLAQGALDRNVHTQGEGLFDIPGFQLMDETGFLYPLSRIPDRAERDAEQAYDFSGDTYDYYFNTHGRDSYDGIGSTLLSTVNFFDVRFCPDNASWRLDLRQMVYCTSATKANDVVAHELTHGVTQFSVGEEEGLLYVWQSGALNESYSDVFGTMVDRDDWLMGEDRDSGAVRDVSNPPAYEDPDHVKSQYYRPLESECKRANDYCGVHTNSGVPNKVAWLLSEPGEHIHYGVTVQGIGREKVERIYYKTLTEKLSPSSGFYAAYIFTRQSCDELIGEFDITPENCEEVSRAFQSVGIDSRIQTFVGEAGADVYASLVSYAGDLNNDGYDDILVGDPFSDDGGQDRGKAYIYYGGLIVDDIPDVVMRGESEYDGFGYSISGAGDVNNDGYDDVIVGAVHAGDSLEGRAYLYYGGMSMDNRADIIFDGFFFQGLYGAAVSSAGDVNNDGYDDILVSGVGTTWERAEIFYGGRNMDTQPDVFLSTSDPQVEFGRSLASIGDVNNDGFDDVAVSDYLLEVFGETRGKVYVYFGGADMDGNADVEMIGEQHRGSFGYKLAGGFDVNNDGYDEVIVAEAENAHMGEESGKVYVYFGGADMDDNADVQFIGGKAGDQLGSDVALVKDVNSDGFDDVLIGASGRYGSGYASGAAFVYYGASLMDATPDLELYGDESNDAFGSTLDFAGDINNDGYTDAVIGAPRASLPPFYRDGAAYLHTLY